MREIWAKGKLVTDEGEEIGVEPMIPSMPKRANYDFAEAANLALNIACLVACAALGGASGWFGHWLLNPPAFSEAQQELISKGYADAAVHLGEMGKVCQNGEGTVTACRLLILNGEEIARRGSEQSQISMKVE